MIESSLTKRRALYKGELGLFPTHEMAQDDFAFITEGDEVFGRYYSLRNMAALNRLWALVDLTAQNSDRWLDKNEAMDDLKIRAAYSKLVWDSKEQDWVNRPKSLTRINNETLRLITERIEQIVLSEILPTMKRNTLRRRIEEMITPRRAA